MPLCASDDRACGVWWAAALDEQGEPYPGCDAADKAPTAPQAAAEGKHAIPLMGAQCGGAH